MKTRLSEWSSIAEIASGLAVVATLVMLILGIRENTDVNRVSVYAGLIDSVNDWDRSIYEDPELARILKAYRDQQPEALSEGDMSRLERILSVLFRNYEKAYFFRQSDVIGEGEWRRFDGFICGNRNRANAYELDIDNSLNQDFLDYIMRTCGMPSE